MSPISPDTLIKVLIVVFVVVVMHLSMSSRQGGRQGIGRDFDICQKIAVEFPTPRQKVVTGTNKNSNIPTPGQ